MYLTSFPQSLTILKFPHSVTVHVFHTIFSMHTFISVYHLLNTSLILPSPKELRAVYIIPPPPSIFVLLTFLWNWELVPSSNDLLWLNGLFTPHPHIFMVLVWHTTRGITWTHFRLTQQHMLHMNFQCNWSCIPSFCETHTEFNSVTNRNFFHMRPSKSSA